jgi:hypothetical protein
MYNCMNSPIKLFEENLNKQKTRKTKLNQTINARD